MRKTCHGPGSTGITRWLSGAVVIGLGGLAVALGATSAVAEPSAAFTIRTSLDGKTVLPHRIRWIAYPSAPVLFPGVEFLIDGKVVFANRLEPFAFGADGRDEATRTVKTGYLVTSWLSPGKHAFTVRARGLGANRKTTATSTVVARVAAPPAALAQLTGTWQRNLTTAVPPDRNVLYRGVTAQPGTYRIAVDRRFIRMSGPAPRKHIKIDYVSGPATITIRGPVWTGDPDEGAVCDPWGPEATYSWSVSDRTLTLAPASSADACKQRGAIVTGEWTRVK
jgi:hypothetical protein